MVDAPASGNGSGEVDVVDAPSTDDDEVDVVALDEESDLDDEPSAMVAVAGIAIVDDDLDEVDDEEYELPEIVPATPDIGDDEVAEADDDADEVVAREGDLDEEVSDDILEELRRADIDGPIVEFAPQDDTTSARRGRIELSWWH